MRRESEEETRAKEHSTIKTEVCDLQRVSWGVTGWLLGLLPDQESLTDHRLLWNRIVGRQSASPAKNTHTHATKNKLWQPMLHIVTLSILKCEHVSTSRNSLSDFWHRCSWSNMVTREFLMPALELRDTTLLSLWMSDIIDLLHIRRRCFVIECK